MSTHPTPPRVDLDRLYAITSTQGTALSEGCLCGGCMTRANYLTMLAAAGRDINPLVNAAMSDCTLNVELSCTVCGFVPGPSAIFDPCAPCDEDCHHPGLPHIGTADVEGWGTPDEDGCDATNDDEYRCNLRANHGSRRHIAGNDSHVIAIWADRA